MRDFQSMSKRNRKGFIYSLTIVSSNQFDLDFGISPEPRDCGWRTNYQICGLITRSTMDITNFEDFERPNRKVVGFLCRGSEKERKKLNS